MHVNHEITDNDSGKNSNRDSHHPPLSFKLHSLAPAGKQPAYLENLIAQIWPTRAQKIYQLFLEGASDIENLNDHPFVIRVNEEYVGITGFYLYDKIEQKEVGLSWHGIIPQARKQGLSKAVFNTVSQIAKEVYPDATHIVELIPEDRLSELAPYFEKLGFVFSGELAHFDYLPKTTNWLIYKAEIPVINQKNKHNQMIEMGELSFTVNQYWYLKNYKPPLNPKIATKEEIKALFNIRD
jgi:hypothetical protein